MTELERIRERGYAIDGQENELDGRCIGAPVTGPDGRVVAAGGSKTVWVKLPIHGGQDYIPRFGWVDHRTVWVETLTRDHKHRDLYFADAATGQSHVVLQIADEKFIDDNYDVSVGDGTIVFTNWTDGHNHL